MRIFIFVAIATAIAAFLAWQLLTFPANFIVCVLLIFTSLFAYIGWQVQLHRYAKDSVKGLNRLLTWHLGIVVLAPMLSIIANSLYSLVGDANASSLITFMLFSVAVFLGFIANLTTAFFIRRS